MKLAIVVVLVACVAYAAAEGCDNMQKMKVNRQWRAAYGSGSHRVELGLELFKSLFNLQPETKALFASANSENIYSPEFKSYTQRILAEFDALIGLLDDSEGLKAQVDYFKAKVAKKGFTAEQLQMFGRTLVNVLPEEIGTTKFDYNAWADCLKKLFAAVKP